jgi:hypothetical protein
VFLLVPLCWRRWPNEQTILDIRDFQVTVALLAHNGAQIVPLNGAASLYAPDWNEYQWFRPFMEVEAARLELPLLTLERALFVAFDYWPSRRAVGMTWPQWGAALRGAWP